MCAATNASHLLGCLRDSMAAIAAICGRRPWRTLQGRSTCRLTQAQHRQFCIAATIAAIAFAIAPHKSRRTNSPAANAHAIIFAGACDQDHHSAPLHLPLHIHESGPYERPDGRRERLKDTVMIGFLKSELFRKFCGGFVLGAVLVFTFGGEESPVLESGMSAIAAQDS